MLGESRLLPLLNHSLHRYSCHFARYNTTVAIECTVLTLVGPHWTACILAYAATS
jgi:hypothetical protein